jgi:hypothetical protein
VFPRILIVQLLGLAIWLSISAIGCAQTVPTDSQSKPTSPLSIEIPKGLQKDLSPAKISQDLMNIYKLYHSRQQEGSGEPEKEVIPSQPPPQISNGFVTIDAIASKDAGTLKTDLEKLGLKKSAMFGRVVSGLFPITEIPKLSNLESLRFARASLAKAHDFPDSVKEKKNH